MNAVVSSHLRSLHFDAVLASLLLDNLQYHLEGGTRGPAFLAIHALVEAPWLPRGTAVSAGKLCEELSSCWSRLSSLPQASIAISYETFLLSHGVSPSRHERNTTLHATVPWLPPYEFFESTTLGDVAGTLVGNLIRLAWEAPRRERLWVRACRAQ